MLVNNNVGTVRRIDDLGRILIPKEIRRILNMKEGCPLNIRLSDDKKHIIISKYVSKDIEYDNLLKLLKVLIPEGDSLAIYTRLDEYPVATTNIPKFKNRKYDDEMSNYYKVNTVYYKFGETLIHIVSDIQDDNLRETIANVTREYLNREV